MVDRSLGTLKSLMQSLDPSRNPASEGAPSDYRGGVLLGSMIASLGGLFAVIIIVASISTGTSVVQGVLGIAPAAALLVGVGLFLMRKAKLGLWGMYFLSAYFGLVFLLELAGAITSKRPDGPIRSLTELAMLMIWWSIVKYFFIRRRQFTNLWGSWRRGSRVQT